MDPSVQPLSAWLQLQRNPEWVGFPSNPVANGIKKLFWPQEPRSEPG